MLPHASTAPATPAADRLVDSWPLRNDHLAAFARRFPSADGSDYDSLAEAALTDPAGFWTAVLDHSAIEYTGSPSPAMEETPAPPYARFFPNLSVNYAREILRGPADEDPTRPVVVALAEDGARTLCTRAELRLRVGAVRAELRAAGITRGDVVAAVMPNRLDAVVVFLAAASLGAIWSACGPDLTPAGILSRLAPLEPAALLVATDVRSGGARIDLSASMGAVLDGLPTVETLLVSGDDVTRVTGAAGRTPARSRTVDEAVLEHAGAAAEFDDVPFDHPLWVLHTSGTTGPVKGIVHGHGGILLEHSKLMRLQNDIGPTDRVAWFTSVGWMLWNVNVSLIATGATVYLLEGSPLHPDAMQPWRLAAEERITFLGCVSPLVNFAASAGLSPVDAFDLAALRAVTVSGAPLLPDAARWVTTALGDGVVPLSMSGGTDICSAFLQPAPGGPISADAIAGRALAVDAEVFDENGRATRGRIGELVVTTPLPSMPVMLWNDPDGELYRTAYYEQYPGVWCHGDAVEERTDGSFVMHGRSDATLNRAGMRVGTTEYYRAISAVAGVEDSLVVEARSGATETEIIAFVVLADGADLEEVSRDVRDAVAGALSPAHVPDRVVAAPSVPRTVTSKPCEVPVGRILRGVDPDRAVNRDALADPGSIDFYVEFAGTRGV
ncbi:MAG: acetoacetate--CoA ligase [Microbacterium gubbeenense]|uniref:acetoacetate--CoA ligase n=2 Tax=Microbacterium gubbeenense TaxID=159896 RepID=UPI00040E532A|nr:acetoacetate--CoA ligase [Microbacterium gubbeenense]